MVVYSNEFDFIQQCPSRQDKIKAIEAIQDTLILQMAKGALTSDKTSYTLNDGQTQISVNYRSVEEMQKMWDSLERIKNKYINSITGRIVRLVDSKNLNGNGGFY